MSFSRILVAGAGGPLGLEIVRRLRARGARVIATYRTGRPGLAAAIEAFGAEPLQLDFEDGPALARTLAAVDGAVLTPILSVSKRAAPFLRMGVRAIFFSSNNVAIDPEDRVYAALNRAEDEILNAATGAVILRPCMIYGYPGDGNMSRLMNAMRRSPIIPLPGGGKALQQPVYYEDLAEIAVRTLLDEAQDERLYAVAGPQPITQRALYRSVAEAIGAKPAVIPAPVNLLAPVINALQKAGIAAPVSAAQLRRARWDKTPRNAPVLNGETPFETGVRSLAAALDGDGRGA